MFYRAYGAILAVAMAALPVAAAAQVIPPSAQPGRERERFLQPQTPQAQPAGPTVTLPSTLAPKGAEKISLHVRIVRVTGSTVYTAAQLEPLYADLVGQRVSLAAIYALAQRITAKYGSDGYVLSRAVIPPQDLDPKGAIIHVQVVEGYIDKVEWPQQVSRYRNFFAEYAAKITAERPANIHTIERYLLLAGDLPGLKFSTALRPSKEPAASVLVVQVAEKSIDANAHIDNRGTPAQGPFEYYGSTTFNNLLGWQEALTFTYAGTVPLQELNYAALNYRQVLNSEGLTFFADFSDVLGEPGTLPLQQLGYRTFGPYGDVGLSYPSFDRARPTSPCRVSSSQAIIKAMCSGRPSAMIGCAASEAKPRATSRMRGKESIRPMRLSAKASRGSAARKTVTRWPRAP